MISDSSSSETHGFRLRGGLATAEACCAMIDIDVPPNGAAPVADS
jgi:hypothetical protein